MNVDRIRWEYRENPRFPTQGDYVPEAGVIELNVFECAGMQGRDCVYLLTHEYIHFWLHREISFLASMQFDVISYPMNRKRESRVSRWIHQGGR